MLGLYPQNGDRIVTIDSVTSLHPMYSAKYREKESEALYIRIRSNYKTIQVLIRSGVFGLK